MLLQPSVVIAVWSAAVTPMIEAHRAAIAGLVLSGHRNWLYPISPDGDPPPFTKSSRVKAVAPDSFGVKPWYSKPATDCVPVAASASTTAFRHSGDSWVVLSGVPVVLNRSP